MDSLLFAIAVLIPLAAGCGIVLLASPHRMSILELLGFSWLAGTAATSLLSFWLGMILKGGALRSAVTAIAICCAVAGIKRRRATINLSLPLKGIADQLLALTIAVQLVAMICVSIRLALGYDGLVLWELKATLLLSNGGVMPAGYFADVGANYPHPHYPLYLPLTEAWIYEWLGHRDQGLLKLLFPLYYLTAAGVLINAAVRLAGRARPGLLAAALLFFVPTIIIRVSSGEADFPLGVFYLAAVASVIEYYLTGESTSVRLAGVTGAALMWVKQEGFALWFCLLVVGSLRAVLLGRKREMLWLLLPGLTVTMAWLIFLEVSHARITPDYLPLSVKTLAGNLDRGPAIVRALFAELSNWRSWNLLWAMPLLLLMLLRRNQAQTARWAATALLVMLIVPLGFFCVGYFFSAWTPFTSHIEASLPRILAQVAPAVFLVIVFLGRNSLSDSIMTPTSSAAS
jgi:hypothetical protein